MNTQLARNLRNNLTDAEKRLWRKLRGRQIHSAKFRRQCPIGNYIVDFVSLEAMLVVEVDGSQHFQPENAAQDKLRDAYLAGQGLKVLHFDNLQVLKETEAVLSVIGTEVAKRFSGEVQP